MNKHYSKNLFYNSILLINDGGICYARNPWRPQFIISNSVAGTDVFVELKFQFLPKFKKSVLSSQFQFQNVRNSVLSSKFHMCKNSVLSSILYFDNFHDPRVAVLCSGAQRSDNSLVVKIRGSLPSYAY